MKQKYSTPMGENLVGWQWVTDSNGQSKRVPIPYNCACGEPANYGFEQVWYCTFCWQKARLFAETSHDDSDT